MRSRLFILALILQISLSSFPVSILAQTSSDQMSLQQMASLISSLQSILNSLKSKVAALKGTSSISIAQAQTADVTNGLISLWKLDEGSGTSASDSIGNNIGTLTSGPTWTMGKIGGGINFDGVDDYVNVPDPNIVEGVSALTVAAWAKSSLLSTVNGRGIVAQTRLGTDAFNLVWRNSNKVACEINTGVIARSQANVVMSDTNWHHYLCVYNGSNVLLYVDGVLQTEQPVQTGNTVVSAAPVTIGTYDTSRNWAGLIDEVRIYNRALTASEVQIVYAYAGGPPPAPDTQAPTTPAGVSAVPISSSQINLSWTASSDNVGVTGYRVYRGGIQIATPPSASYSDAGLSPSTTYSYTVAAVDAAGNVSPQSTSASATTQAPPPPDTISPSIPTNLLATAISSSQINLSWTASTDNVGVVGYRIYRGGSQIGTTAGVSYQNTGLTASTNYSYTVAAYDAAGNVSSQSTSVNATTQAVTTGCSGTNFSFGIFSDTYGGQEGGLRRTFNEMLAKDPNIRFLSTGGDTPEHSSIRSILNTELSDSLNCGATEFPWLPTVGNHPWIDTGPEDAVNRDWWTVNYGNNWSTNPAASRLATQLPGVSNFRRGPTQVLTSTGSISIPHATIFSFDYNNAHFVMVNSYEQQLTGDNNAGVWDVNGPSVFDPTNSQLDWLLQDLQSTAKSIKFVFGHTALLYQCYGSVTQCGAGSPPPPTYSEHNSNFHNAELTRVLAENNVAAYFFGHDHVISRRLMNPDRTAAYSRSYWDIMNEPNKPIGTPSQWESLQGPGRVWQVDAGRVYSGQGNYIITKVSDSSVTFEIYHYDTGNSLYTTTQLVDTWTLPIGVAPPPPPADTTAPSTPSNLSATAVSSSQINLAWTASTDNVGVTGYRVYRNGTQIGTPSSASYSDTGLSPSTVYSYAVSAVDAANNVSAQSSSISATTQASAPAPSTKFVIGDQVQAIANLNVRSVPSISGALLGTQSVNSLGMVMGGPTFADGFWWWNINYDNAPDGWSVEDYLQKYSTPPPPPTGVVLYVDQNIASASCATYDVATRSCTGGASTAYGTVAGAAAAAQPGTTVLFRAATYNEALIPARSGAPGSYITFQAYPGETVDLKSSNRAINISDRNYIIIDGFRVADTRWFEAINAHHNIVRNNTFLRLLNPSGTAANVRFIHSTYNKILNNHIESGNDNLTLIGDSFYNLVEGNTIKEGRHSIWGIRCGDFNVVRNNYFSNTIQKIGEVYDCGVDTSGDGLVANSFDSTKYNLIEGNIFANAVPEAGTGQTTANGNGIQYAGQEGIVRKNVFYHNVAGLGIQNYADEALYANNNRIYNNVMHDNTCAGVAFRGGSGNIFKNNILTENKGNNATDCVAVSPAQVLYFSSRISSIGLSARFERNNIFYQAPGDAVIQREFNATGSSLGTYNAFDPGTFINTLEVDPQFVNKTNFDFHLSSISPMIDAGTSLTTTPTAGSGTIMPVADARYFYDGYGIEGEVGDLIQLSGQTQTARVVDINYAGNTLVLDRSLNWTAGQGISLAYNGSAPDIGAYEFSATPPTTLVGDLNLDRIVNSLDWSLMNAAWSTNNVTADLNRDGIVNSLDFSLMNANWGRTN